MTITHGEFERLSGILQRVAMRSDVTADDKLALKTAAQALFFVALKHPGDFAAFLAEVEVPLTPEQKAKLKDMGLTE